MRLALAIFLATSTPVAAQDIGILRECVEGLDEPDVAACRGAYIAPCLAGEPMFPMQCHQNELQLWMEQIRRSASPLIDWAEDAQFDDAARGRAFDFWRGVQTEIQANEEACADLRFVDMVDDTFSNAEYFACVINGNEETLTRLRRFMAEFP